MRNYLELAAKTPILVCSLALTGLLFLVFPALPIGGPMLDTLPGYTHAEALATMDGYGEAGRRVYIWASLILDTLLPLAYVCLMAGAVYRWSSERLRWLAYLPVGAGAVDLCENVQVIALLVRYPDVSPLQVQAASLFTQTKAVAFLACLALAVLAAAIAAVRRLTTKGSAG